MTLLPESADGPYRYRPTSSDDMKTAPCDSQFFPWRWTRRRERETACDDLVLNCGHGDCDYAEHLLGVAAAVRGRHVSAAVAMARPASLESRIRLILDRGLCRRAPGRAALVALTILCALTLWPLAALRGRVARAQEPPVPPVLSQAKSVDLLVLEKATGRPIEGAEVVYATNPSFALTHP
jgi:hypothetical protein